MKPSRYSGRGAALALALATLMIGCRGSERNGADAVGSGVADSIADGRGQAAIEGAVRDVRGDERRVVLFLGTSLTAGYGLQPDRSYPALLQARIDSAGLPFQAVNAGVSGETSAGALRRIDWVLQQPFDVLVLETGGNDMLRGTDPAATEQNIQAIVDRVRARRPEARILLAGMLAMPNLGRDYVERFEPIYSRVAERNGLTIIPFLLEGVAGERSLNLEDGIHPNAEGQRLVADNVWRVLEPVLREEAAARAGA